MVHDDVLAHLLKIQNMNKYKKLTFFVHAASILNYLFRVCVLLMALVDVLTDILERIVLNLY